MSKENVSTHSASLARSNWMPSTGANRASGKPETSGNTPWLAVFQYTDGTLPAAEATFDNFELRTYEVPQVGIERAVQLTWPAPAGMNYTVEGGPTVQGPWLPVNDVATPGLKQMTVPANDVMKFFRLQQAP